VKPDIAKKAVAPSGQSPSLSSPVPGNIPPISGIQAFDGDLTILRECDANHVFYFYFPILFKKHIFLLDENTLIQGIIEICKRFHGG
jgi:hypothetical protein